MLRSAKKVDAILASVREDASDYFIKIGDYDTSNAVKTELSNITKTLYNRLPMVRATVDALEKHAVYVGYDGQAMATRSATYSDNLILMHPIADDCSKSFIAAYTHELTHMDQDRRGLLRQYEVPSDPALLVDFLMHNLALEAAAYASETLSLYYVSHFSGLDESYPEIADYFHEYCAESAGREHAGFYIERNLKGEDLPSKADLRNAWAGLFLSFFEPESKHVKNYLGGFCQDYLRRLKQKSEMSNAFNSTRPWGDVAAIARISDIAGLGGVFDKDKARIVEHVILASVTRQEYASLLDLTRQQALNFISAEDIAMERLAKVFKP